MIFRLKYIYLFFIILMPISSLVGFSIMGGSSEDIAFSLLHVAGMILLFAYLYTFISMNVSSINSRPNIVVYGLFVLSVLSTFLSYNPFFSFSGEVYRYEGLISLISYYSLFLASAFLLDREGNYKIKLINTFIMVGIFSGIFGLFQKFTDIQFFGNNFNGAIEGLNANPNFFGSYMTLQFSISLVAFLFTSEKIKSYLYGLASVFFFILAIFSSTVSSWVATGFVYIILFIVMLSLIAFKKANLVNKLGKLIFIGVVYIGSFIIINLFYDWAYLYELGIIASDASGIIVDKTVEGTMGSNRILIWTKTLEILPENWLNGVGVDALGAYMRDKVAQDPSFLLNSGEYFDKAHNEVLHIAITQGIPAAITYLVWLALVIKNGIQRVKESKLFSRDPDGEVDPNAWVWLALLMAIVGYFIQSNFNISVVTVAPYFWIFAGLLCPYPWDEKSLVKRDLGNSFKLVRKTKDK